MEIFRQKMVGWRDQQEKMGGKVGSENAIVAPQE